MKLVRLVGLCLVVAFTINAVAAAAASAEVPEFGRCLKVEGVKVGKKTVYNGGYSNPPCTIPNGEKKGRYEWSAGGGAKKKFTGEFGATILAPVTKGTIECAGGSSEGEYTGAKTETVTLTLESCEALPAHQSCQNVGSAVGEVKTMSLNGELGFINKTAIPPAVGLDLKAATGEIAAAFECGGGGHGTGTQVVLEGSVIGQIRPVNKMSPAFTVTYRTKAGKQFPEQFEGGVKDTLKTESIVGIEKTTEESRLTTLNTNTNEESMEVKGK
jgi:hypothetical protein